jgi:hypothetical protein
VAARPSIHEKVTLLRDVVFANLFADGLSMASGNYLGISGAGGCITIE